MRRKTTAIRTSKPNYADKPRPVLHKQDFVPRYKAGEFGNASPTWNDLSEFLENYNLGPEGKVHIRNRIAQGKTWYNVPVREILVAWREATQQVSYQDLYISAMAPHQYNVIQGEVWQTENHLLLWYSSAVGVPMREALLGPTRHVEGIEAVIILRTLMCPNSWERLNYLLDAYDNHVIEFSTFSVNWGTLPNYNTVYWEVRNY